MEDVRGRPKDRKQLDEIILADEKLGRRLAETWLLLNGYLGANTARGDAAYGRLREVGRQFE